MDGLCDRANDPHYCCLPMAHDGAHCCRCGQEWVQAQPLGGRP